jgi:lysophospholipase L1-like esterase
MLIVLTKGDTFGAEIASKFISKRQMHPSAQQYLAISRQMKMAIALVGLCYLIGSPLASKGQVSIQKQDSLRKARYARLGTDWANLGRYSEANKALPPKSAKPRVVLLGNSITDAWPSVDSSFFQSGPYEIIGRGISGQVSGQMLARFADDAVKLKPDVVAILTGTNDIAENDGPYDSAVTFRNISSILYLAQSQGIRVVLCSVTPATDFSWRPGRKPALKIVALNKKLASLAKHQHIPFVNYHRALADAHLGLGPKLSSDGVHPNLNGYKIMEPLLLKAIAAALADSK